MIFLLIIIYIIYKNFWHSNQYQPTSDFLLFSWRS